MDEQTTDNSSMNGLNKQMESDTSSVIKTNLSPGKVVRRPKTASNKTHNNRSSFPQARSPFSESKAAHHLEQKIITMSSTLGSNDESSGSSERLTAEGSFIVNVSALECFLVVPSFCRRWR